MPVTYNFTVRAIDDSNAYADRSFSITVNNTSVYRFICAGNSTTKIKRSFDGKTWDTYTFASAMTTPVKVAYGNNNWIIWHAITAADGAGTHLQKSVDGVSWTQYSPIISGTHPDPYVITWAGYVNGAWWIAARGTSSTNIQTISKSTDGGNTFTVVGTANFTSGSSTISGIDYDPINDIYVMLGYTTTNGGPDRILTSDDGGATWTETLSYGSYHFDEDDRQQLQYINGVWIANLQSANTGTNQVYTSVDGYNWSVSFAAATGYITPNVVYGNGQLVLLRYKSGASQIYTSNNAGSSWDLVSSGYVVNNNVPNEGYSFAFNRGIWVAKENGSEKFYYNETNDLVNTNWVEASGDTPENTFYIATRK